MWMNRSAPTLVAAVTALWATAASAETPAALCTRVGTDDTLRPVPRQMSDEVNALFHAKMPPATVSRSTVFRCVDRHVKVCTTGANLPCGKAERSKSPTAGTTAWCREHPEVTFVPAVATGHDTIYEWRCVGGTPRIGNQVLHTDPRGFVAEFWKDLR